MTRKDRKEYINSITKSIDKNNIKKARKQWTIAGMSLLVATGLGAISSNLTHASANAHHARPIKNTNNKRHSHLIHGKRYTLRNRSHRNRGRKNKKRAKRQYKIKRTKNTKQYQHYVIQRTGASMSKATKAVPNSVNLTSKKPINLKANTPSVTHNGLHIEYIDQAGHTVTTKDISGSNDSKITIGQYPARVPVGYRLVRRQRTHYTVNNGVQTVRVHVIGDVINGTVTLHLRYIMKDGNIWHQTKKIRVRAHLGDNPLKFDPNKYNRGRYHTVDKPATLSLGWATTGFGVSRSFTYYQNKMNQPPKQPNKPANNNKPSNNNNNRPKVNPNNHPKNNGGNTPNNNPVKPNNNNQNNHHHNSNHNHNNQNRRPNNNNKKNKKPNNKTNQTSVSHSILGVEELRNNQKTQYKGQTVTRLNTKGHFRHLRFMRNTGVYDDVLLANNSRRGTLHKGECLPTLKIWRIFAVHNPKTNQTKLRYQVHIGYMNYFITGNSNYTRNAYITHKDVASKLNNHSLYIKTIRNVAEYKSKYYNSKTKIKNIKRGTKLHVKRIVSIGHQGYQQTRFVLNDGHYVTANYNYVRIV